MDTTSRLGTYSTGMIEVPSDSIRSSPSPSIPVGSLLHHQPRVRSVHREVFPLGVCPDVFQSLKEIVPIADDVVEGLILEHRARSLAQLGHAPPDVALDIVQNLSEPVPLTGLRFERRQQQMYMVRHADRRVKAVLPAVREEATVHDQVTFFGRELALAAAEGDEIGGVRALYMWKVAAGGGLVIDRATEGAGFLRIGGCA